MSKIPDNIITQVKFEYYPDRPYGGQSCGIPSRGVRLIHEESGFKVETDWFRSSYQAKNFLLTLFELYLEEIKVI